MRRRWFTWFATFCALWFITFSAVAQQSDISAPGTEARVDVRNRGSAGIQIKGTISGGSFQFEASLEDNPTNWKPLAVCPVDGGVAVTSGTAVGIWSVDVAGLKWVRVVTAGGLTGTATVIRLAASPTGRSTCAVSVNSTAFVNNLLGMTTLGQKTSANSISFVLSSDGAITINPSTTGGLSPHTKTSAASTNATSVKGSAGQVYVVTARNFRSTPPYLKLYNVSGTPTCNSDTVVWKEPIPVASTAVNGSGFILPIPYGLSFSTGIGYCITANIGDTDNTAIAANDVVLNIGFK